MSANERTLHPSHVIFHLSLQTSSVSHLYKFNALSIITVVPCSPWGDGRRPTRYISRLFPLPYPQFFSLCLSDICHMIVLVLCFDDRVRGDSGFTRFYATFVGYVVMFQDTNLPIYMALFGSFQCAICMICPSCYNEVPEQYESKLT